MLHLFGAESVKQAAAAASHKINLKGHVQKCQKQPERGVLRNLEVMSYGNGCFSM